MSEPPYQQAREFIKYGIQVIYPRSSLRVHRGGLFVSDYLRSLSSTAATPNPARTPITGAGDCCVGWVVGFSVAMIVGVASSFVEFSVGSAVGFSVGVTVGVIVGSWFGAVWPSCRMIVYPVSFDELGVYGVGVGVFSLSIFTAV